jgi:hypothetical protein
MRGALITGTAKQQHPKNCRLVNSQCNSAVATAPKHGQNNVTTPVYMHNRILGLSHYIVRHKHKTVRIGKL